jgi:aromatic-L-amino-acid decarboxylase
MKPRSVPQPNNLPDIPAAYDWEAFRQNGYKVIDFIVDYNKSLQARSIPVCNKVQPGFLAQAMGSPQSAPDRPVPFDSVLRDVQSHVLPGMLHWQHPDFYAFFPCQASPPAMLGEMMANMFNQPGFNWMCSPAASELEIMVSDWITKSFGLPQEFLWTGTGGMVLQPTATEAAVVAMVSARNRVLGRLGSDVQPKLVAYCSDQAHFCIEKACRIVGVPHVRKIITTRDERDGNYPMTAGAIEQQMQLDIASGLVPFFVSANFGSTGICTIDPLDAVADLCAAHGLWFNVDAAYAGVVAVCPEMRSLLKGFERADTILINGHKWFSMLFNTAFMFFRDKGSIVASLNASGVYLFNEETASGTVVDFKDYHLGLGRPFRSLKVYTVLQCFGISGLQAAIRRHVELAKYLAQLLIEASNGSLLAVPVDTKFGLVCFRLQEQRSEDDQLAFLAALNKTQKMFLVHTIVEGKVILRISLASPTISAADIEDLASLIISTAQTFQTSQK